MSHLSILLKKKINEEMLYLHIKWTLCIRISKWPDPFDLDLDLDLTVLVITKKPLYSFSSSDLCINQSQKKKMKNLVMKGLKHCLRLMRGNESRHSNIHKVWGKRMSEDILEAMLFFEIFL